MVDRTVEPGPRGISRRKALGRILGLGLGLGATAVLPTASTPNKPQPPAETDNATATISESKAEAIPEEERYKGIVQEVDPSMTQLLVTRIQETSILRDPSLLRDPNNFAICSMVFQNREGTYPKIEESTRVTLLVVDEPNEERIGWNKVIMFRAGHATPELLDTAVIYSPTKGPRPVWYLPHEGANISESGERLVAAPDNYSPNSHVLERDNESRYHLFPLSAIKFRQDRDNGIGDGILIDRLPQRMGELMSPRTA